MKTDDEKLSEILVDALASALPGTSVDEVDTTALRDALSTDDDLKRLHFFPPDEGVDPQSFVDAATRAVTAVNEGRSERVAVFRRAEKQPLISEEEFTSGCLFTSWRRKPYTWEELDTLRERALVNNDPTVTAVSS